MSSDYFDSITPFALRACDPFNPPQTKWKLDAFKVTRSILRMLDNPDVIYQSCFGLCGQVAFLRAWAYRDPVAVARFAIDLYTNGSAKIGGFEVSPDDEMLWCSWMAQPTVPPHPDFEDGKWGPGNPITESVWMICGGLANVTNNLIAYVIDAGASIADYPGQGKFDGHPASNAWTLALPGNIKQWLEETSCYVSVEDNTDATDKLEHHYNKTLASDNIITSSFTKADDIILCINTDMLYRATAITPTPTTTIDPPPFIGVPNHYVMLTSPITRSGDTLTMNIWTWGAYYEVQVSLSDFNDNYYGSIIAYAKTEYSHKRSLNLPSNLKNAIREARIYYTQGPPTGDKLHFRWECENQDVEWFELHRIGRTDVSPVDGGLMQYRDILKRIWHQNGIQDFHISMELQDWADPYGTPYEIVACHSVLRPYKCDPFSYNGYDSVQCRINADYEYSGPIRPLCETETTNFRIRYNDVQIPLLESRSADKNITIGGRVIGHCHSDGSIDIGQNGIFVTVGTDQYTPLYVQIVAVWLEYYCSIFSESPFFLQNPGAGTKILITIGVRCSPFIDSEGVARIGIPPDLDDAHMMDLLFDDFLAITYDRYIKPDSRNLASYDEYGWKTVPGLLVRDYIMNERNIPALLEAFIQQPSQGLLGDMGKAAIWTYACSQYAFSKTAPIEDRAGLGLIGKFWNYAGLELYGSKKNPDFNLWSKIMANQISQVMSKNIQLGWGARIYNADSFDEFVYSLPGGKDVFNDNTLFTNFVLAVSQSMYPGIGTDSRFRFSDTVRPLLSPPVSDHKLTSGMSVVISGTLSSSHSMQFHGVTLDPGVGFVSMNKMFSANESYVIQIVLLDANDQLIDVIRMDETNGNRQIGLRNGQIKKMFIGISCSVLQGQNFTFRYELLATAPSSDLMITRWNRLQGWELSNNPADFVWDFDTPDLWLTSEDNTPRDVINVEPARAKKHKEPVKSIVHFIVHNFGNLAGNVKVSLFWQDLGDEYPVPAVRDEPDDDHWLAMELYDMQSGQRLSGNSIVVNVPANGKTEAAVKWLYPIRQATDNVPIAAILDYPGLAVHSSSRAVKCHVAAADGRVTRPRKPVKTKPVRPKHPKSGKAARKASRKSNSKKQKNGKRK